MHVIRQSRWEMLPPLPEGVRSSFIQYLDTIQSLEGQGVQVKVSDISDAMELQDRELQELSKRWKKKDTLRKWLLKQMDVSHT